MGSTVSALVGLFLLKYASKKYPLKTADDEILQEVTHKNEVPKEATNA
jgi:hypothetical protein